MYSYMQQMTGSAWGAGMPWAGFFWLMMPLLVWSIAWKGVALWKSAKRNELVWFIVFLVVNTFGILEILYIFIFSKMKMSKRRR